MTHSPSLCRPIPMFVLGLCLLMSGLHAAPPDLTAPGVIAGINRSSTYNLGPTGLRGWIHLSGGAGNTHGADGTMTGESRQILVTVAEAPANDNDALAVDDVILGAIAAGSGTVPDFSSDARKAFGAAIGESEIAGAGFLRVKRWRAGTITDVNIAITPMGEYTATAPYNCPKSSHILANARNQLVSQLLALSPPAPTLLTNDWKGAISGLALLAGVQPGDPDYDTVRSRLQTYARARASAGPQPVSLPIWDWAYIGLFLAEYYLATGDAAVLPGINSYTLKLSVSQSINGTFGHSASVLRPDGSGRRMGIGYGPVNAVGIVANMAIVLGKKALLAGGQAIDPEIDGAIQRGSDFFAFYVNKGPIPYGEHEPFISGHSSNGKDPMCAVLFGLQTGRAAETEYYARVTTASYRGREYGHTGQGFSYLWSALGANMGGELAVAEHLKPVRWHLDLSRRTDGSFAYDGAEQYGGGSTSGGTYLGATGYYGMNPTASFILTFALPLQRLYITGKRDTPANPPPLTLDAATVAHAVAAGNFKVDSPGFTNAQLIASLSDYDPVVRHYAAIELGKATRTLSSAELTTLRNMVTGPDANGRMGSCQALGLRQDTTALPTIVQRLNKTPETDLWVRAKAASAIRSYTPATASTHRDTMLTAFAANATDPDVIVWSDPIQMSNNFLSLALFGDSIYGGNNIGSYTVNAAKNLLYPAVQAGLKQPDSYSRAGASRFCFDRLPLADVQALIPDLFKVIEIECLADRMWANDSRANGIRTLSKYKVSEGIPYALAMLDIPAGFGWGSGTTINAGLNALASYGDAARWTLPTLRTYIGTWSPTSSESTTLTNTIASIENAITAPAQVPGLAVANSQIVSTTGPKAITLTGSSPRSSVTFTNVTAPIHGTLTGTAPNLTYTPDSGYTGPDFFTFQVVDNLGTAYPSAPGTVSLIVGPSGNGLVGEYFNNADFTSPVLTRIDPQINFDWGTGSPHASIGADTFSVRWSGVLLVPESGNYTFSSLTSDGIRVYVNGTLVIDRFVDQSTRWTDGNPIYLAAGQMADLYVEYYENTGSAVAKLKWTGPSFAGANGAIIPQAYLFDGSGMTNRPAYAFPQNLSTNQNTPLHITLNGSGGTLTYTVLTQPANGTLTGTAPNLTYTPNTNFSGTDSFTFIVNNGATNSLPATISINVQAGALTQFTWATATSGNWSDAARWTPGVPAAAGQANYALNFTPAGTYTVTHDLNSGFQLNQLNAASTLTISGTQSISFVANGGAPPQFNQNSGNQVTVNSPINLAAVTNFGGSNSGNVTLTNQVTGPGGILKSNPGRLRINGFNANNFTGGTVVNNGTLHLGAMVDGISPLVTNPLGAGPVTLNGAIIEFERVTASHPLTVNGGTLFSNNGWGATWSGPVTLNHTLTARCNWPFTMSGAISGSAGIIKIGSHELRLTVANSYTGTTDVRDGTVVCSHASALGTGPLIITAPARVTLNYTGTRVIESLTLDATLMPPGTYGSSTSTASYKNNTYFSGNGTLTVPQPTTTALSLTNGSTPADPGSSLTFTATVTGTSPTGNVQFFSGTTLLGISTLNASFQASFTTNQLAIGPHSITARYTGNSTNAPSTSPAVLVGINNTPVSAPSNLTATSAFTQINLGWTASTGASGYYVKRSTADGGPYTVIALVTGTTYQDSAILGGVTYHYTISAINGAGESADSNQASAYIGSASASITSLTSSPVGTGIYGTSVTFTASVTTASGTPSGAVTFRNGSNIIGTGNLSSGTASLVISTLAVAEHAITASYEGEGPHDPSTSAALSYQVTPKPLTITGVTASNKTYDGTTTAVLSSGTLSGVISGDTVTIVAGSGAFASANAGTWAVSASGYTIGGTHTANYTLSGQPTVPNATITARPIHITGTKTYDATTTAAPNILSISNNLDGENLALSGTAELSAKDAGNRTIVTGAAPLARIQSAKAGTSGNSTSLAVTLPVAPTSGSTLIAVISTRGTSADLVSGITGGGVTWTRVSQATNTSGSTTEIWVGPDVSNGTAGTTITTAASLRSAAVVMEYSGLLLPASFDVAANNTGSGTTANTGTTITTSQANQLWIGGIGIAGSAPTLGSLTNSFIAVDNSASTGSGGAGNQSRTYALERMVTSTGTASTGGTLSATAQWSGAIATFQAASSLSLTGPAAGNYTLSGMTGSVIITPKALTLTGLASSNRDYDGTPSAPLAGSPTLPTGQAPGTGTTSDGNPYTGDTLTLDGTASGTFATKHIGNQKTVTITGITLGGPQGGNYSLNTPTDLTANVTPLPITVSAVSASKTYDGTTTANGTPTLEPALAPGDTASVLTQEFESATAGTANKVIIPTITIDDGNEGANYAVTLVNFDTGTIDKAPQTITFDPLAAVSVNDAPFALSATASSGLDVSYTSSDPEVAAVSERNVIITGPGSATITALQAGNDNYHAAAVVPQTLIVNSVATPYEDWAAGHPDFGDSDPTANPDGDSLNNLLEYAFGTDPTRADGGSIVYVADGAVTHPGAPIVQNLGLGEGVDFHAVFARRKNHQTSGLTYTVEFSADLIHWSESAATPTVLTGASNPSDVEAVSVPYPSLVPAAGSDTKPTYFRVAVTMP